MNEAFWRGRRVLLTGHTGFKGAWLWWWLRELGAEVTGYSLPPLTPSLALASGMPAEPGSHHGDMRDAAALTACVRAAQPEVVLHLAAQALVRESYRHPADTFATNVVGTVNLLEAVRATPTVRAVVVVTTDKCYENHGWAWGYRENDPLGGHDPYSASKACAEIAVDACRRSYFTPGVPGAHPARLATGRAGNVLGGGDFAADRLVPDIFRALAAGEPVRLRFPHAIRPWQHVLEPLQGYLLLAERLASEPGGAAATHGWNFGPADEDACTVGELTRQVLAVWGQGSWVDDSRPDAPPEAQVLRLDASLARRQLAWRPHLPLPEALAWTAAWQRAYHDGAPARALTIDQINAYRQRLAAPAPAAPPLPPVTGIPA